MRSLLIQVPMQIPGELNPNARVADYLKRQAKRVYQEAVIWLSVEARGKWERAHRLKWIPLEKAKIDLEFVFPTRRRRDDDNLRASFKCGQDALVKAQIIKDDNQECLKMGTIRVSKGSPATIIKVTELSVEEVK